jgi:hypothetical protein
VPTTLLSPVPGLTRPCTTAPRGRQEGRLPCNETDLTRALGMVDPGTVASTMADVIAAGVDWGTHFRSIGWREPRRPNPYINTGRYLDTHDVPAGVNPLLHYVLHGEPHGLPPSPHFGPAWYRDRYAIGPTSTGLAPYQKHRRSQRFSPLPTFDVVAQIKMHTATLHPDRDPYAHFWVIGRFSQGRREPSGPSYCLSVEVEASVVRRTTLQSRCRATRNGVYVTCRVIYALAPTRLTPAPSSA